MNYFIGNLHCMCKVITLALISVGNFTPTLRAIVIDLTYTDYSNSSWEIHSEHWSQIHFSRSVCCQTGWRMLDMTCHFFYLICWFKTCTSSLGGELFAVCHQQCGISMGGVRGSVCFQACCRVWWWKMSLISQSALRHIHDCSLLNGLINGLGEEQDLRHS